MRIYNYNTEKREDNLDKYMIAIGTGVGIAFLLIFFTKALFYLGDLVIKYWIWILVVMVVLFFIRRYVKKKW